jgi:acetyl-CoA acetyltransferase
MALRGMRVAIVGVGYSRVGRRTGLSLEHLTAQAAAAARADAGIRTSEIDGVAVHAFPHRYVAATQTADLLGIRDLAWYSGSTDGAAYSVAALHGIAAVASGSCHTCLTVRTVHQAGAASARASGQRPQAAGNKQFLRPYGSITRAHRAGLYMRRHMDLYGTTEEQFGALAVAQREYAARNPEAIQREPLMIEDYLNSRYISKPLRLLDCDYPVDSGSALITTAERARHLANKPVFFEAWAAGTTDTLDFQLVEEMTESSPWRAAKRLWSRTDLTPSDVDVAGLYDGFTFITLQWLEALGFCGKGESGQFVQEGHTRPGGTDSNQHRRRRMQHGAATRRQLLHRGDPATPGCVGRAPGPWRGGGRGEQRGRRQCYLCAAHDIVTDSPFPMDRTTHVPPRRLLLLTSTCVGWLRSSSKWSNFQPAIRCPEPPRQFDRRHLVTLDTGSRPGPLAMR